MSEIPYTLSEKQKEAIANLPFAANLANEPELFQLLKDAASTDPQVAQSAKQRLGEILSIGLQAAFDA